MNIEQTDKQTNIMQICKQINQRAYKPTLMTLNETNKQTYGTTKACKLIATNLEQTDKQT